MNRVQIEEGFRVKMPKEVRGDLSVGDEVVITVDHAGRIIILSPQRIQEALRHTAGLWEGRTDIPGDGVRYVNKMRRGRRLRRLKVANRAADRH